MKTSSKELQHDFMNLQHKGKQTLRLFVLLFFILLFVYMGIQGYMISILQDDFKEHMYEYLWKIGLQIIWILPLWQLWNYRRFGKWLYFICLLLTLYECKAMYDYVMVDFTTLLNSTYGSLLLACIWRLFLITGFIKLVHNPHIRSIWSVYDMFDDELSEEEEDFHQTPVKKETPLEIKAKKHLHTYAIRVSLMLYTFMIAVFVLLLVLKIQLPDMKEGIEIVERTVFGNFLFTAFLWILPISAMYMYHRSTRWLLSFCLLAEALKIIFSFDRCLYIFTSPLVPSFASITFLIIEVLRFFILIFWVQKVLRDPYGYYYWKKYGNTER